MWLGVERLWRFAAKRSLQSPSRSEKRLPWHLRTCLREATQSSSRWPPVHGGPPSTVAAFRMCHQKRHAGLLEHDSKGCSHMAVAEPSKVAPKSRRRQTWKQRGFSIAFPLLFLSFPPMFPKEVVKRHLSVRNPLEAPSLWLMWPHTSN